MADNDSGAGSRREHTVSALLDAWAAGDLLLGAGLIRQMREEVARDALRQPFLTPAPPDISGVRVGGRTIRTGDSLDVRLAKYVQHAVREEHWPPGTTFDEFLASLTDVVEGDQSGIFADRRNDGWRLTFVGWSGVWEGLDGGPVILVLYHCVQRRLVTAFQPTRGLRYVNDNDQVGGGGWLRRLR